VSHSVTLVLVHHHRMGSSRAGVLEWRGRVVGCSVVVRSMNRRSEGTEVGVALLGLPSFSMLLVS
jgi:hypothetical protein